MSFDQQVRCTDDGHCDGVYHLYPRIFPAVIVAHHCDRVPCSIVGDFASKVAALEWLDATGRRRTFGEA